MAYSMTNKGIKEGWTFQTNWFKNTVFCKQAQVCLEQEAQYRPSDCLKIAEIGCSGSASFWAENNHGVFIPTKSAFKF